MRRGLFGQDVDQLCVYAPVFEMEDRIFRIVPRGKADHEEVHPRIDQPVGQRSGQKGAVGGDIRQGIRVLLDVPNSLGQLLVEQGLVHQVGGYMFQIPALSHDLLKERIVHASMTDPLAHRRVGTEGTGPVTPAYRLYLNARRFGPHIYIESVANEFRLREAHAGYRFIFR